MQSNLNMLRNKIIRKQFYTQKLILSSNLTHLVKLEMEVYLSASIIVGLESKD